MIKVACPAKINLSLKVLGKREDGFHNIDSVMQTIDLFDYLTIEVKNGCGITLCGNSGEIPYDETNLVYKAAKLIAPDKKIHIHIEKNIPVAAGLAGGSTDAAGTFYGINKLLGEPMTRAQLHEMCAQLGSDLNFCLEGARARATGRGEILESLEFEPFNVSLIKPLDLGISAKEAYTEFFSDGSSNDLEPAMVAKYPQLRKIKELYPNAVMSGSGPAYFLVNAEFAPLEGYWIKNNLKSIPHGCL